MRRPSLLPSVLTSGLLAALVLAGGPASAGPDPSSPEYTARDTQNIADAYGRVTEGQLQNPAYLPALVQASTQRHVDQLLAQAAAPNRPAITPGNLFPGWNVGNPLRAGWDGTRGLSRKVAFTNRYGALLRGHVYRPKPGARDPYTGRKLTGPFPGVVLTEGSVQGSEGMYEWLAQDLAERGYVVLTYDVQGQGTSETLPHQDGPVDTNALPFCNPFAAPEDGESSGCPGVPSQQLSNFVVGTRNALSFFTSTPDQHYRNPGAGDTAVSAYNPFWRQFDRSPDPHPATPGRTSRIAIIGHSMGAAAVSKVQGTDDRVAAVVALDKLTGPGSDGPLDGSGNTPVVPALAVQSEYGFTVSPWYLSGGSSLNPTPSPEGPDPMRERRTGYDAWRAAGVDSMLVVPRASTHLEYTDIPLVLPASRYGQDLTSVYVQRWLDRYLKHRDNTDSLLGRSFRYLEPTGDGQWSPVRLHRDRLLSFYYCSAYGLATDGGTRASGDVTDVGC
ncbi:alpha/beta hydrolase [Nocardioides sp. KIGAM211]|uniref:Alpha/beta hydrolase n=1 Tax=Nocardioides luti TaxID=2761101 RepID=A0A7X0VAH2_9ACTN|nr:alpha/beta hydrolase [Nocardioides luti]MBB6627749.1 alpha/beta hydrolase [Nocardioides luti]